MKFHTRLAGLLAAAAFAGGCASSSQPITASLAQPSSAAAPGYTLGAEELDYDCKKLTGRMQVRLLEIRDYNERSGSTLASRMLQSTVTAVFGGPERGEDPSGAIARDVAMLEAYNRQLAAKGCKTFNLAEELQPKDVRVTPVPTVAAPAKSAQP